MVEKTVKNGCAYTYMGTKAKEAFDKINIDISAFDFARIQYDKPEKEKKERKKQKKYVCDCPDNIVRSRKELNATCSDCGSKFEVLEEDE